MPIREDEMNQPAAASLKAEGSDDEVGLAMDHEVDDTAAESAPRKRRGRGKKRKVENDVDGDVDLTTAEGQLAMNPGMTLEQATNEAKREYHRLNAAKSRARNKEYVEELKKKVA